MSEIQYTIGELAAKIDAKVHGDANVNILNVASLQFAQAGQLSYLDNIKYRKFLNTTQASAVILDPSNLEYCKTNAIVTSNPSLAYAQIAKFFQQIPKTNPIIHSSAVIGNNCNIATSVSIGACCVIEDNVSIGENTNIHPGTVVGANCKIGKDCRIWANVTLYYGVNIGNRVEIHSGAVIGADGFGLAKSKNGFIKVPQLGSVIIEDDVEIGANTTIDRGAIESTHIGIGVKLDNQIQIGHNVQIGSNSVIAGCVGIAGSTKIGKNCMIGGGAGIVGHIDIADNVFVAAMTGISKPITEAGIYIAGIQADKRENWKKNAVAFRHLGEMAERLNNLEKQVFPEIEE